LAGRVATVSRQRTDEDAFADRDAQADERHHIRRVGEKSTAPRAARRIKLGEAFDDLAKIAKLPRYPTPFDTLNTALGLGGHVGGQIIVLAGGTGMGKTTLLLDFAQHYASHFGPVLYVSLEMRAGHCIARAAAPHMGVFANQLLSGEVVYQPHQVPISDRIEFVEECTLGELDPTIDEMRSEYGEEPLVVIDYLQKMVARMMAGEARPDPRLATTAVSAGLLATARRQGVPMLVASSTGRGSAAKLRGKPGRRGGDPRDLPPGELVDVSAESSAIEYDSQATLALHVSDEVDIDGYQIATLTAAKCRFGRAMHIAMGYDGARAIWIDRGRVERKKPGDGVNADQVSAARLAELEKLAVAIVQVLRVAPASKTALAKTLKTRKSDVVDAIYGLRSKGLVTEKGQGSAARIHLTELGGAPPELPGIGEPANKTVGVHP
jgi:RecA/RadA recombinase